MDTDRKILLVGCGNMGAALLEGWLAQGIDPQVLRVVDTQAKALERARDLGIAAQASIGSAAADVLVLAVKPQQLEPLLPDCRRLASDGALIVSIAAGKPLAFFERLLGERASVVRAMPNTPAAIGQGITALVSNAAVSSDQRTRAESLMQGVGEVVWIDDEALMDAVTAVSGSGPAYVFLLIDALTRAGRDAGLEAGLAERLATVTVAGAGVYAKQSTSDAAALREQVTSPGGTTEAALEILMADDVLVSLLREAVRAAAVRSRELAG